MCFAIVLKVRKSNSISICHMVNGANLKNWWKKYPRSDDEDVFALGRGEHVPVRGQLFVVRDVDQPLAQHQLIRIL